MRSIKGFLMYKKCILYVTLLFSLSAYCNLYPMDPPSKPSNAMGIRIVGNSILVCAKAAPTSIAAVTGGAFLSFAALNVMDGTKCSPYQTIIYGTLGLLISWYGYKKAPNKNVYLGMLGATSAGWSGVGINQKWTER
jgi:hypothetical protein